jgi:predicted O-methyltransferase YrrM
MTLALCRRFPRLHATIIDFPNVVELAHEYVAAAGLQDRVTLLAGNALDVEWPASDVVLMSYLLSAVSGDHIPVLLDRAATSLAGSGGVLLVHDFMLDDDRLGPDLAALWFLQYLAERVDSVSFTAGELRDRLEHLGYRDVTDEVLIPDITKLVTARWGGPPR